MNTTGATPRNLMKEKKLSALKTGAGWRIRRKDLKEL
jgi:excisionase family DNA binding protein